MDDATTIAQKKTSVVAPTEVFCIHWILISLLPIGIIAYAHEMSNMRENLLSLFFFISGSNVLYQFF